jgi:hypothetical protein
MMIQSERTGSKESSSILPALKACASRWRRISSLLPVVETQCGRGLLLFTCALPFPGKADAADARMG